jgi:hypothetical protein
MIRQERTRRSMDMKNELAVLRQMLEKKVSEAD